MILGRKHVSSILHMSANKCTSTFCSNLILINFIGKRTNFTGKRTNFDQLDVHSFNNGGSRWQAEVAAETIRCRLLVLVFQPYSRDFHVHHRACCLDSDCN